MRVEPAVKGRKGGIVVKTAGQFNVAAQARDHGRRRNTPRRACGLLRHAVAWTLFAAILCLAVPRAGAHPVSLTSVLVNVTDGKITVELNMLAEDLILYYSMGTDGDFRFPAGELKEQAHKHKDFLLRYLQLRDYDGGRIQGEIIDIDLSDIPPEGVHMDDMMAHSIRYHFEFPIDERIEYLTVSQNFGGEEPAVPSEMDVRVFHHGVLMERALLSHRTAHTVRLDWEAGWEQAADDLEAARERLRQRREDALGITSYSRVYSYVYITDTEIRHEILIPLLTLDTWLPLEREDSAVMTVEEQERAAAAVEDFLQRHNHVEINGSPVAPTLERLDFFGPEFRDFARAAPRREVSVYNARAGIILSFPTPETPRELRFEWDYFDDNLPYYRPTIYVFEDGKKNVMLNFLNKGIEWKADSTREPFRLAEIEEPAPTPLLHLPVLSLAGAVGVLIFAAAAVRTGPTCRRVACGTLAIVLAAGAVATLPYGRATVPHPFQSLPEISEEHARALFEKLHRNIYRAFEHRDEERIYDALDASVAGRLLEDLYLQIRKNLVLEEQGGAVSRVRKIELIDGELKATPHAQRDRQAFVYACTWTVTGTVEHWGHIHTRKNQYRAVFTVEGLPSGWRITDFEPLHEERLEMQIRLRQ